MGAVEQRVEQKMGAVEQRVEQTMGAVEQRVEQTMGAVGCMHLRENWVQRTQDRREQRDVHVASPCTTRPRRPWRDRRMLRQPLAATMKKKME